MFAQRQVQIDSEDDGTDDSESEASFPSLTTYFNSLISGKKLSFFMTVCMKRGG